MSFDKSPTLGVVHGIVLQAISQGKMHSLGSVKRGLKHRMSGDSVEQMMAHLVHRGYLSIKTGNIYVLTPKGWQFVPKAQAQIDMTRYVPPSFEPARPGANDYKRMPSVAAGIRRPYWAEGMK